jgi:hypothetical protein
MRGFTAEASAESALMCRMPGCRNRWTVDMANGRLCSYHDAAVTHNHGGKPPEGLPKRQAAIPLREAMRPFSEPTERDEVEF